MKDELLIVYSSSTGFTKEYAQDLAKEFPQAKLMDFSEFTKEIAENYKLIVFGSWLRAGRIVNLPKFLNLIDLNKQKVIIFTTGANPLDGKDIAKYWRNNLSEIQLKKIPHYYLPGGMRLEEMPASSKLMIGALKLFLKLKPRKSEDDIAQLEQLKQSFDNSSPKYLKPIITRIKNI